MIRVISLLLIFVVVTEQLFPCKITVKVKSTTAKKVKTEVFVPSLGIQSNPIITNGKDQEKKVLIEGKDCDSKQWMIRTYEWVNEQWFDGKNISAKYLGNGYVRFIVGDDLMPQPMDRMGVMCSEGYCG